MIVNERLSNRGTSPSSQFQNSDRKWKKGKHLSVCKLVIVSWPAQEGNDHEDTCAAARGRLASSDVMHTARTHTLRAGNRQHARHHPPRLARCRLPHCISPSAFLSWRLILDTSWNTCRWHDIWGLHLINPGWGRGAGGGGQGAGWNRMCVNWDWEWTRGSDYTILYLYFSITKLFLKRQKPSFFPPWYFPNIQMLIMLSKQKQERSSQQNWLNPTLAELGQEKSYKWALHICSLNIYLLGNYPAPGPLL